MLSQPFTLGFTVSEVEVMGHHLPPIVSRTLQARSSRDHFRVITQGKMCFPTLSTLVRAGGQRQIGNEIKYLLTSTQKSGPKDMNRTRRGKNTCQCYILCEYRTSTHKAVSLAPLSIPKPAAGCQSGLCLRTQMSLPDEPHLLISGVGHYMVGHPVFLNSASYPLL